MAKHLEIIERKGRRYVMVPEPLYNEWMEDAEMRDDVNAFDRAKQAAEGKEIFPGEFVFTLAGAKTGGERLALWRGYRDMTQEALAKKSGVNRVMISQIEHGNRKGSVDTLKRLALALKCDIDDIA